MRMRELCSEQMGPLRTFISSDARFYAKRANTDHASRICRIKSKKKGEMKQKTACFSRILPAERIIAKNCTFLSFSSREEPLFWGVKKSSSSWREEFGMRRRRPFGKNSFPFGVKFNGLWTAIRFLVGWILFFFFDALACVGTII